MLKKTAIIGAGVLLLLGLFFGRDACSYVSTSVGWMHDTVHESIPLEFQIERAQRMIKDLDPEIQRNMHLIAKQDVRVQDLQDELKNVEEQLAKSEREIKQLNGDLERGDTYYVYANGEFTAKQVKKDLANRWERFKVKQATAEKLRDILAARETGLAAAKDKLKEMQNAKRQLEVDVANLEARLELVKVAQTASEINFDDSHLSRTKELVKEIDARISVLDKVVNADTTYAEEIQLDDPEVQDVTDEITEYFSAQPGNENLVELN